MIECPRQSAHYTFFLEFWQNSKVHYGDNWSGDVIDAHGVDGCATCANWFAIGKGNRDRNLVHQASKCKIVVAADEVHGCVAEDDGAPLLYLSQSGCVSMGGATALQLEIKITPPFGSRDQVRRLRLHFEK